MRMITVGSVLLVLAIAMTMPVALSAQPPPSAWPPVEQCYPMSPEQARPSITLQIWIVGGLSLPEYTVSQNTAFYLIYRWAFLPTNVAYRLDDGTPVTAYMNLQDRTDSGEIHYTVTINDATVNPTSKFTATCKWWRFQNDHYEAVAPRALVHEYYIEFPYGLPVGDYVIYAYGENHLTTFSRTVILHVTE
jgi:hypothetical protein